MQLSKDDPLVRTAVLGKQIENFLDSDVGRLVAQRAADEIDACAEILKKTSPRHFWGRAKIERLQNKIAIAESVIRWLADAVTEGQQATQILEDAND